MDKVKYLIIDLNLSFYAGLCYISENEEFRTFNKIETKYIENINKIIDGDQGTNEQKAIMINVISALTAAVGAIGYYKAGKDFAAAAMGLMIGALGAAFQKVTDLLWGLF